MKAIYNGTCKISQYKPIFKLGKDYAVCFEYLVLKAAAQPKLKNGRFVKTNELVDSDECSYKYMIFESLPNVKTIKNALEEYINNNVVKKITNDFMFDEKKIHLTKENQMNYKAAYDLAVQTNGANLPYKIKTSDKNGNTQYIVFNTVDELSMFYVAMNAHINRCIEEGWRKKDAIDYSIYVA